MAVPSPAIAALLLKSNTRSALVRNPLVCLSVGNVVSR